MTVQGCYFLISEPAAVAWFFIMPFFALLTIQSTEHLKADFHQFKPLFNSTFCKVHQHCRTPALSTCMVVDCN